MFFIFVKKIFLFLLILLLAAPHHVLGENKATLYFLSESSSYAIGQKINISIMVDPRGTAFDTVKAIIAFPSDILQVESVFLNPDFSAADPDNGYDNVKGSFSYAAGVPGGIDKISQFATITLLTKKSGSSTISFDPQSLILNGGENIIALGQPIAFTITQVLVLPQSVVPSQQKSSAPSKKQNVEPADEGGKDNPALAALTTDAIPIVTQADKKNLFWFLKYAISLIIILTSLIFFRKRIFALLRRKP